LICNVLFGEAFQIHVNRHDMKKIFTVEEANRTLILVLQIARDVQSGFHALKVLRATDPGNEDERHKAISKIEHNLEELAQVGCIFSDVGAGFVEFPAYFKGRPILLCWGVDEGHVSHWHYVKENCHDRREVTEEILAGSNANLFAEMVL
jgi:hypothetical protein